MSVKIPIETSARHIHVSEVDFKLLFGDDFKLAERLVGISSS